jgi:hypothetical protein
VEASIEPRYLLREPTLSEDQTNDPVTSFGAFLVKEWRF